MDVCEYGCTGVLTIGSTVLNCPAWDIPNLVRLWAEASVRGENKVLPTVTGRRGYPTRLDQSEFDLPFFITGRCQPDGTPYALDQWYTGLQANLDALWTGVFAPVTTGAGTRSASLTMPSGATRTATVQVEPLRFVNDVEDAGLVEAVIHLKVVSGRFV